MPETVLIIVAIGGIIAAVLRAVPAIVWSLRCDPQSRNYKHPPRNGWFEKLPPR